MTPFAGYQVKGIYPLSHGEADSGQAARLSHFQEVSL